MTATIESLGLVSDDGARLSIWDGASEQSLALALKRPVIRCLEQGVQEHPSDNQLRDDMLVLDMTTRSALRLNVTKVFLDALGERLHLPVDLWLRILTVANEFVMNAVLHGNLELDSSLRQSFDGMMKLQEIIETRLADRSIAARAVRLEVCWTSGMIYLLVGDSGRGFDWSVRCANKVGAPRGSGRGLGIVEALSSSVEFLCGGTIIKAGFVR